LISSFLKKFWLEDERIQTTFNFDDLVKSHEMVIASASEAILFLSVPENTRLLRRPAKAELLAMTEYRLFTNPSILASIILIANLKKMKSFVNLFQRRP